MTLRAFGAETQRPDNGPVCFAEPLAVRTPNVPSLSM